MRRILMRTEKIISVNEQSAPSVGSAVLAVFISMLLSIGLTFMYGTAFDLVFKFFPAFIILFLASLGFTILHYQNKTRLSIAAMIIAPLALAVMLIFNWFNVRNGLLDFLYYVKYYVFFQFPGIYADPEDDGATVFAFIIAYNLITTCATTFVLLRRKCIPAALLNYLPIFICSVANIVMRPAQISCLVMAAGVFLLLLTHAFRMKKQETAERILLIIAVPMFALTLLTGVIFPEKRYGQDKLATNILTSIQEKVDTASSKDNAVSRMLDKAINGFRNPNGGSGMSDIFSPLYATSTNLTRVGPFDPSQDRIMTVYKSSNPDYDGDVPMYRGNTLYLKVESFDKYEDNVLSSTKIRTNIYKPGFEAESETAQYSLLITPLAEAGVDIVPYYTDFYIMDYTGESRVNPFNTTQVKDFHYAYSPVPVKTGNIYSDWYLDQYVYKTALTVPKATENALTMSGKLPDWYMEVYMGHIEMSDAEKVRRVTNYVRALHPYNKDTELPPEGVDFVPWFVSEAESGICVHYAITSVILLRMIGVPARYVRGYVDTRSYNNSESVIFASQAHAWFEFFVPEYGWIMGDATPGYGSDASYFNIDAVAQVSPEINEASFSREHYKTAKENGAYETTRTTETTVETTEETSWETDESTDTQDPSDPSDLTPTPTLAPGEDPTAPSSGTEPSATSYYDGQVHNDYEFPENPVIPKGELAVIKAFVAVMIAAVFVVILILLAKLVFAAYWLNKVNTENINDKAIAYYHYYRLLGRIFRFTLPSKATEIVEKAAFSGGDISPKELNMLLTICKEHLKACSNSFSSYKMSLLRLLDVEFKDHR